MGLGDDGILTTASRERNVLDKAAADAKAALATTLGTGPTSTMGVGALNPYCCVLFFLGPFLTIIFHLLFPTLRVSFALHAILRIALPCDSLDLESCGILLVHGELTQLSLSFLSFPLCLHSLLRLL